MQSLVRRQLMFTLGMLASGGILALAASQWVGVRGIEGVIYSILLCLIPGWLTIFASGFARSKDLAVYAVLLGTGLRMTFVLLGLLIVGAMRPELGFRDFTAWLIPSYMISLAMETGILLTPASVKVPTQPDA